MAAEDTQGREKDNGRGCAQKNSLERIHSMERSEVRVLKLGAVKSAAFRTGLEKCLWASCRHTLPLLLLPIQGQPPPFSGSPTSIYFNIHSTVLFERP